MLSLTRRVEESLLIYPDDEVDPSMTVAELFAQGPIEIRVIQIKGEQARLGINAPRVLSVMRNELLQKDGDPSILLGED